MSNTVIAHDFDGNEHEVELSQLRWRPSAYGIVIKDGKLLLLKQINGYDLPGGGVDIGEGLEAAVTREIKEETGITAANPRLIAATTSFYVPFSMPDHPMQAVMLYYSCDYESGDLSKDGFDEGEQIYAEGPEWLPLEGLKDIKIGTSVDFRGYVKQALGQ